MTDIAPRWRWRHLDAPKWTYQNSLKDTLHAAYPRAAEFEHCNAAGSWCHHHRTVNAQLTGQESLPI